MHFDPDKLLLILSKCVFVNDRESGAKLMLGLQITFSEYIHLPIWNLQIMTTYCILVFSSFMDIYNLYNLVEVDFNHLRHGLTLRFFHYLRG